MRDTLKQIGGHHDHAVDAVAALRGLLVDEGLLQRMQLVEGAEPLDCYNLLFPNILNRRHTGARWLSVKQHGAGATLPKATSKLRTVKSEIVAKHIKQRRVRL